MPPPDEPLDRSKFVPIRTLSERHRPSLISHLLALGASDRYLRFGYAASDEQIRGYVDHIDFDHDEVFGIFNRRLVLIGLAHLACESADAATKHAGTNAEFGVSVSAHARGRGYGKRLFEYAVLRGRARGVDSLIIHALTRNIGMLAIVRGAGAVVDTSGGDSEARLLLPPEDAASRVRASLTRHLGELDYQFKLGSRDSLDATSRPEPT